MIIGQIIGHLLTPPGLHHRVIDSGRGWLYPLDLSGRSTCYRFVPQPLVDR